MTDQASRAQEYDRIARHYDERLGLYARETIEEAVRVANLSGVEAVLDTCCGTGELLQQIALANHRGPLVGIDFSQTMLNVAVRRLVNYPHVSLKPTPIESLGFPDGYFHIVFNTNAFRYLHQPKVALKEIYRVIRPHGRLILVDLMASSRITRLWHFIRRHIQPVYKNVYRFDELEEMLRSTGFIITRHKRWRVNLFWSVVLFEVHKPAPSARPAQQA